MKHDEDIKARAKPCADCGPKKLGPTAATSFDVLTKWGVSAELATTIVELGIRASEDNDPFSVLTMAMAASAERATACLEALKEAEVEVEELQKEFDSLEDTYNEAVAAFEGSYSPVDIPVPSDKEEEGDF